MPDRRMIIVGGGLAAAKAAQALRQEGFDGEVTVLAGEPVIPYHRPELSKGYLHGKAELEGLAVHPQSWYAEHHVDLRLDTRAVAVDVHGHQVTTDADEILRYDKLLLATGSAPVVPPVPGAHRARTLRTAADAEDLRHGLRLGGRVVVIGAGWIGLEVAAAARLAGCDVTVVETAPTPLYSVLGAELGERFAAVHRDHGVVMRLGSGVAEIAEGEVVLTGGDRLPADVVVAGVGARPNVELAAVAGLAVDNGILVDASLRTEHPDVFAAGDVARAFHPGIAGLLRVEHWANALNQGLAAGRSMLGITEPYQRVPYFYTDQFSLGMEYSGYVGPAGYDQVLYRGDPDTLEFIAFWLRDGIVLAGMNVNVWDVTAPIQELVRSGWTGQRVDLQLLVDMDVPLEELAPIR